MSTLDQRLQVLVDRGQRERLDREAQRTGDSVGELVRAAIDRAYPHDRDERHRAAQRLLDAEPMPVGDWAEMKREMWDEITGVEA